MIGENAVTAEQNKKVANMLEELSIASLDSVYYIISF